jgi:hypothetical protein
VSLVVSVMPKAPSGERLSVAAASHSKQLSNVHDQRRAMALVWALTLAPVFCILMLGVIAAEASRCLE